MLLFNATDIETYSSAEEALSNPAPSNIGSSNKISDHRSCIVAGGEGSCLTQKNLERLEAELPRYPAEESTAMTPMERFRRQESCTGPWIAGSR
jgi:hypothetical protein